MYATIFNFIHNLIYQKFLARSISFTYFVYNIFFTKSKIIWLLLKSGPGSWTQTLKI